MRIHTTFQFTQPEIDITADFFNLKPWAKESGVVKMQKYQAWWDGMTDFYTMPRQHLVYIDNQSLAYILDEPQAGVVPLLHLSVVSLFHAFRHQLQKHWNISPEDRCLDAVEWATSLYYSSRPETFCNAVRDGKIPFVTPADLIEMDDVGVSVASQVREDFEDMMDNLFESLTDEDEGLIDLMSQMEGE